MGLVGDHRHGLEHGPGLQVMRTFSTHPDEEIREEMLYRLSKLTGDPVGEIS